MPRKARPHHRPRRTDEADTIIQISRIVGSVGREGPQVRPDRTQFVGEVMDVKAEDSVMAKGGLLEIAKVKPLVFAPDTQAYYGIGHFVGQAFSVGKGI